MTTLIERLDAALRKSLGHNLRQEVLGFILPIIESDRAALEAEVARLREQAIKEITDYRERMLAFGTDFGNWKANAADELEVLVKGAMRK